MKPTIKLLIGAPLSGHEAVFLRRLDADLNGSEALILANFNTEKRQIDFVVVTPVFAALLELKNFPRPVFGHQNGIWTYKNFAGARVRYAGENPWQQAKDAKFALSDEMLEFQKRHGVVPPPACRSYFMQFDAFVCIYPRIHPESQVTRGDHKVRVASYDEVVDAISSRSISSTWSLDDWRLFAKEHFNLAEVTLEEATDPKVLEASEKLRAYRARIDAMIGTDLPPLFSGSRNPDYGGDLIESMLEPRNFVLQGPSGSTKTFHLHHLALKICGKGEELPLLLEAKKYRGGDFLALLRWAVAPFFCGDPRELLDAARLCGIPPVLLLDAVNECRAEYRQDLMRGVQSFALAYGARVVFTSQSPIKLSGDIRATLKQLPLPERDQKRAIYAYHARVPSAPDLDYFCSAFTNAYDLTVAGRCHNSAAKPGSRTDLYDRYVRRCLPDHTVVVSALLRAIAGQMGKEVSYVWSRDTFERFAERFLAEQHAPLIVLDELCRSRLIQLTDNCFSFEHELLFDYFRAEDLRCRVGDVEKLAEELRKPRNNNLVELVVSRFTEAPGIAAVLDAASDARVLCRVVEGRCGPAAQAVIVRQCEALLDAAARDLPNIEVIFETDQLRDGKRIFSPQSLVSVELKGARNWTAYDALLCDVIVLNLENSILQRKFLDLLALTEWSLKAAVQKAAKENSVGFSEPWEEMVRLYSGLLQFGKLEVPCVGILSKIRTAQMHPRRYKQGLPIRADLFERAFGMPASHFSMAALLEDLGRGDNPGDVETNLKLTQQAWDTGIYILRIMAAELLQRMSRHVYEKCPEEVRRIRKMLEGFEKENAFVDTVVLEALASYGGLELVTSVDQAISEMRQIIAPNIANEPSITELAELCETSTVNYIASRAYGLLSRIFEDIFQGVYYQAYCELSDQEKCDILCLAATASEADFHTGWVLRELLRYGRERALPIFQQFASCIATDALSIQNSVEPFAFAIEGCAQFGNSMPSYRGGDSPEHTAWRTIGEILFWGIRADDGLDTSQSLQELWARFDGPVSLAAADVLYQLDHSQWRLGDPRGDVDLIEIFGDELCPILEFCLVHRESLPTLFNYGGSRDRNVIRFLIDALGRIGNVGTVPLLQRLVDDGEFGRDALEAIKALQGHMAFELGPA